jgi:hypothetical protein
LFPADGGRPVFSDRGLSFADMWLDPNGPYADLAVVCEFACYISLRPTTADDVERGMCVAGRCLGDARLRMTEPHLLHQVLHVLKPEVLERLHLAPWEGGFEGFPPEWETRLERLRRERIAEAMRVDRAKGACKPRDAYRIPAEDERVLRIRQAASNFMEGWGDAREALTSPHYARQYRMSLPAYALRLPPCEALKLPPWNPPEPPPTAANRPQDTAARRAGREVRRDGVEETVDIIAGSLAQRPIRHGIFQGRGGDGIFQRRGGDG